MQRGKGRDPGLADFTPRHQCSLVVSSHASWSALDRVEVVAGGGGGGLSRSALTSSSCLARGLMSHCIAILKVILFDSCEINGSHQNTPGGDQRRQEVHQTLQETSHQHGTWHFCCLCLLSPFWSVLLYCILFQALLHLVCLTQPPRGQMACVVTSHSFTNCRESCMLRAVQRLFLSIFFHRAQVYAAS